MLADWDPRLITPERALRIAGDWPVWFSVELAELAQFGGQPDQWQINIRCGKCQQSCGLLAYSHTVPDLAGFAGPETTVADQLSQVLKHMVMAHDVSLSGSGDGRE